MQQTSFFPRVAGKVAETVDIFHLPASIKPTIVKEKIYKLEGDTLSLRYPEFSGEEMVKVIDAVLEKRSQYLKDLPVASIVSKIDAAVQLWLDPDYHLRKLAEKLLPAVTGYDSEMIRLELKRYMRTFRKKELLRFLEEEFDSPEMLDEFRPRKSGGLSKAYGPDLIFHVFSGNVPGVQLWSLIMGFLMKSAHLGKTSFSEPFLPVLFLKSLAEIDENLAESTAILPWPGGNSELEAPALESAEAVIVYGSDKTVNSIKQRLPDGQRLLAYGHKISISMIGKEALTPDLYSRTARRLAEDICIYDQQGCLSPQSVYIEEGGTVDPRRFAQLLSAELARYEKKRRRSALSEEEHLSIQRTRGRYELEKLKGSSTAVFKSGMNTDWTVVFHKESGFEASPLNRFVHIFSVTELEGCIGWLKPYKKYMQSCGLAVLPDRLMDISAKLGDAGISRICPVGEMNRAKPGWHHDGSFNLLTLARVIDIERNAEEDMERYDPDVE
ncbi:acyl-CoA reductase [Bacillus infantis]|uniref:acyl-CoA reductase n=1 Tax=Bacillus infantis TaxID=324767 RepID=UPI001CD6B7AC|nr:acyl-CoA reductase [Bacillus infantis]MCA1038545.1 acyl-CoA reductase [Bacillus infantis]